MNYLLHTILVQERMSLMSRILNKRRKREITEDDTKELIKFVFFIFMFCNVQDPKNMKIRI